MGEDFSCYCGVVCANHGAERGQKRLCILARFILVARPGEQRSSAQPVEEACRIWRGLDSVEGSYRGCQGAKEEEEV